MAYFLLGIAAFLPVIAAIALKLIGANKKVQALPYWLRQTIIGVVFGALAIVGTEWGIKVPNAVVNARDAAVVIAGLSFGGPAGIIAGLIGGIERWFAVYWGAGTFTRIACSVSTIIAGLVSAAARKFMFNNKRPGWLMAFTVGFVVETFHLAMVFFTNIHDPLQALEVVEACTIPMLLANSLSVLVANLLIDLIKFGFFTTTPKGAKSIKSTVQNRLLSTLALMLILSASFTYILQNQVSVNRREQLLETSLHEIEADILDSSNANMLALTNDIKDDYETAIAASKTISETLNEILTNYNIAEINIINEAGIIIESSADYKNYDMYSGDQSKEFMDKVKEYGEYVQEYGPIAATPDISRKYAGVKITNGYLQIGYDHDQFSESVSALLVDITKNRHVGQNGFILIVDNNTIIVSKPADLDESGLYDTFKNIKNIKIDKTMEGTFNGEEYYIRYSMSEGYSIVSFLQQSEILNNRNMALYAGIFNEILIFAVMYTLIYSLLERRVIKQINSVNESLEKITDGNLDEKVNVTSNSEFVELSKDINLTVDKLKDYIEQAGKKIDEELQFAKNIQLSALPKPYPMFIKRKEFDIAALMDPAKEVGGDFYDFYITKEGLNFLVADVSGKGIPGAMFMMRAKTELKSLSESGLYVNDVFTIANNELCSGNEAGMFVTAWQGRMSLNSGLVSFSNAGHNHPLVKKKDGKFEYVKSKANLVLAGMEGIPYRSETIQLEPGDIIFLYTDGVTEATNANNELYSESRLRDFLNSKEWGSVDEITSSVKQDIDEFVGEAPQFDDITIVCLRYNGPMTKPALMFENATIDNIQEVTAFVESELEKVGCSPKVIMSMNIAIDEIFSNIVRYAYGATKRGYASVTLDINEEERIVSVSFEDVGAPYNPLEAEEPDVTLSAEDRKIGGLGIFMVRKTMDDVKYEYRHNANVLTLIKKY